MHPIAVFREEESYQSLKLAMSDIYKEVENLELLTLGDETFQIEFYLGGDWKFPAIATGIDAASSTYACMHLVQVLC